MQQTGKGAVGFREKFVIDGVDVEHAFADVEDRVVAKRFEFVDDGQGVTRILSCWNSTLK